MKKPTHRAYYRRIGKQLRKAREVAGLSREDVARSIDRWGDQYCYLIENGKRKYIDLAEINHLCKLYGICAVTLIKR